MSFIEVENLSFRYVKEEQTIDNVSFSINKGEFICILGHNGSGKSTLAKLLVGLLKAKRGKILINGVELTEDTVDELRKEMGIVFQNPDNQFVGVTVKDDIAFGLENRCIKTEEMKEKVEKYAKLVRMEDFLDRNPEELSGGEKQRVAIAGILAMNPELIIFDESTSMLDPKGVKEIIDIIKELKGKKTVISITHNLDEASFADRVIVMNKGKIVLDDTPKNVFKNIETLRDCKLDILNSMKLIDAIQKSNINDKELLEEALWELSYLK